MRAMRKKLNIFTLQLPIYTLFFIRNAFFNSASVLLNFPWIDLQMLLRCCLIHLSIIILWQFLYLLYLYISLDLRLFMSYLCALFFIFIFIFIMINRMNTDALVLLFIFENVFYFNWMITWIKNANNFEITKVQPQSGA